MASIEHLWAGWRSQYLESVTSGTALPAVGGASGEGTLFERILRAEVPDEQSYVVHRGPLCSTILNAYPYTNGHMLVLPNRGVPELDDLSDDELTAVWFEVRDAVAALRRAYGCDGVNVGMNLGRAAGAGVPEHVHVHVLPRWDGDTNFMTAVAETRVLPEPLSASWHKLHAAWPPNEIGA